MHYGVRGQVLEIRVIRPNEDEEERDDLKSDLLDGLIDVVLCSPEQLVPAQEKWRNCHATEVST